MIARALLAVAFLPLAALAQIQLFQFDGVTDTPVGSILIVGSAAPGDTLNTRFHVRNVGTGPATFQTLALAGQGFSISAAPSLPYIIAPGSQAEFDVRFSPTVTGSYSATLAVNTINVILNASVASSASVFLANSATPLISNAVVDFGSVVVGSTHVQGFMLLNAGTATTSVNNISVTGNGFQGPAGISLPISLTPGQTATFQVTFAPQSGQSAQGLLTVGQRAFNLQGQGLNPPLPAASIAFASTLAGSAQQNSVSIPLASASQVSGTGTLTLAFHPSVTGVTDDPAVQFLSGPRRSATVTISAGDTVAKFNGQSSIAFQSGSTAGTIVFTLTLSNGAQQQASLTIQPAPVSFDMATSIRKFGELDVSVSGFDNTYTASQLSFAFFDTKGNPVPPGAISVDASSDFQQYFAATQEGGMFGLLAKFPVTGDTTQIATVNVQVVNSAGVTTAQNVPIGN